jgi:F-type H+-transporting ATPase subunit b
MEGLGINVPTLVAQIVNVLILLGILYLVAYKPIMRLLDERSRRIKESMAQADAIKKEAVRAEEEVKKQLEVASKEGEKRIVQAVKMGEEMKQKAQQEARKAAEVLMARAKTEIQRERDEAIDELRKEFADLTVLAAGKIIDRTLDKKAHRQVIDKVLEESTTLKKG